MRLQIRATQVLTAVGVLAFAAVGAAAVAQYMFDMQPCPWCVLQRFIYIVIGVLALLAALFGGSLRRGTAWLALLAGLSGIASALWQQLYAASQASCDLTLAERITTALHLDRLLPQLFIAYASCADAAVNVLGIPFAVWSCAMFVLLSGLLFWTLRSSKR